jgi:hypothetical protein
MANELIEAGELLVLSSKGDLNALHALIVRSRLDAIKNAIAAGEILNGWHDANKSEYTAYVEQHFSGSVRSALNYRYAFTTWEGLDADQRQEFLDSDEFSIKALMPPKSASVPKRYKSGGSQQNASNTVDATPKPEQDAPATEEPAVSGTDVSTDDAGSVDYDTDLDSALGGPTDLNPTKQVEPTDVECSRCKGSGRVPITAKMPPSLAESPEFINSWQDYQLHQIQKKSSLTTIAISRLFTKLEAWGPTRAIKALEHTMEKGWAGVREDNDKPSPATEKKGRAAMEFTE